MKVAVLPDAAMLIVPLITKNGHEYLSSTNISEETLRDKDPYDERKFDENLPPFTINREQTLTGNKYTTNEVPSGVRGRLSLFDNIIQEAEAAIIIGQPPRKINHMYNKLNELILFCGITCANHQRLVISLLKKKEIPILELAFPNNRNDLINIINKTNIFLKHLEDKKGIYNDDNLNLDLNIQEDKISVKELEQIIKKH